MASAFCQPERDPLGPALNLMARAFDQADALGPLAAWPFYRIVIARMRSTRPDLVASELRLPITVIGPGGQHE